MSNNLITIFSAYIIGGIGGYILGILKERFAWNRLIDKGILPKPKKK
jgi:hypothetical protein